VLNMSLAGPPDFLLKRLLAAAAARDISIVAAASPGEQGLGFPASFEPAIAVVPSDSQGKVQEPAHAAARPLLGAPGIEVLTTAPDTTYDFQSGSSVAAAHVSGVIALLLQSSPKLRASEISALLLQSARRPDAPGIGIVNACSALARIGPIDDCG
jgi:subtilisin family serine protease